jgi:uncharacterized protein YciW
MIPVQTRQPLTEGSDLLDTLVDIHSGPPPVKVRGQRATSTGAIEESYRTLLLPAEPTGLSPLERTLVAYRVAIVTNSAPLVEHYRGQLRRLGATVALVDAAERLSLDEPLPPRIHTLLQQVDRLTSEPQTATRDHLTTLQAQGLSIPDILSLTQLVAFLNFQVRTLAGLQMLAAGV